MTDSSQKWMARTALILVVAPVVIALIHPLWVAPLAVLAGLVLVWLGRKNFDWADLKNFPTLIAVLFCCFAAASLLWSIDTGLTLKRLHRLALLLAFGFVACLVLLKVQSKEDPGKGVVLCTLAVLAISAAIVISSLWFGDALGDAFNTHPTKIFDRTGTVLSLSVWPSLMVALYFSSSLKLEEKQAALLRFGAIAGLIILLIWAVFVSPNRAAQLGLLLGGVGFVFCRLFGAARFVALTAVVGAVFVTPVAMMSVPTSLAEVAENEALPSDIRHRTVIWQFTAEKASERVFLGWGAGVSRVVPGGDEWIEFHQLDGNLVGRGETMPLHPHNAPLQIALELGLFGLGLTTLLLLGAIGGALTIMRNSATATAAFSAWTIACLTMASISYGAWQGWWLSALLLSGATLVFFGRFLPSSSPWLRAK